MLEKKNLVEKTFTNSRFKISDKLKNFSKYVSRQNLTRFLVQHELFKLQLNVKGSIVECGVHQGGGVFTWAKLSSIYEPYNYHRRIIGFDTFEGFPSVSKRHDTTKYAKKRNFSEKVNIINDLEININLFDNERPLNNKKKIFLIKGDANKTIPSYVKKNEHLIISLLYLDFDIYKPTETALKYFISRIPKGGIIAFDEINNPHWPGETMALLRSLKLNKYELKNFSFDPNISYIQL